MVTDLATGEPSPLITGTVLMPNGDLRITVQIGQNGAVVIPGLVSAREHAGHMAQVIEEKEAHDRGLS